MPGRFTSQLSQVKVGQEYSTRAFHAEMQTLRQQGHDVTMKEYLGDIYGEKYTPEQFYQELGVDLSQMTVQKMLNSTDLERWLFPEIFRDAIRTGLQYTPFYRQLVTSDERITSNGVTMPYIPWQTDAEVGMRVTAEGATITEGEMTWGSKQVSIKKRARGLKQTYESIMFTPINLAAIYFQDVGTRLGADLDKDMIDIAINGDQTDGSEAAPVMGAATANTLLYTDIARVWVRLKRVNRNSSAMLTNEADAISILNMDQFNKTLAGGGSISGVTLKVNTPLPSNQDIFVHSSVPSKKIVFIDRARAFVQLTAMPLLIESDKIVARQVQGQYASIITGFANIFRDGRLVLDWSTNLGTNPGPTAYS